MRRTLDGIRIAHVQLSRLGDKRIWVIIMRNEFVAANVATKNFPRIKRRLVVSSSATLYNAKETRRAGKRTS
jgi:hypothetical protein